MPVSFNEPASSDDETPPGKAVRQPKSDSKTIETAKRIVLRENPLTSGAPTPNRITGTETR